MAELERRPVLTQGHADTIANRRGFNLLTVDEQPVAALEVDDRPLTGHKRYPRVPPADVDVVDLHLAVRITADMESGGEALDSAVGQADVEGRGIRAERASDASWPRGGRQKRAAVPAATARLPRRPQERLSPAYSSDISELIKRASTVSCGRASIDDRSIPRSASCSPSSERRSLFVRARRRWHMAWLFHEPSSSRARPVFRCVLESV